jgi:hypothetical protein
VNLHTQGAHEGSLELLRQCQQTETMLERSPVSNDKVIVKYDRLACKVLGSDQAEELKQQILHIEDLDDARILSRLLGKSKSS